VEKVEKFDSTQIFGQKYDSALPHVTRISVLDGYNVRCLQLALRFEPCHDYSLVLSLLVVFLLLNLFLLFVVFWQLQHHLHAIEFNLSKKKPRSECISMTSWVHTF